MNERYWGNTANSWGRMARLLHWTLAALLILQWFAGEYDDAFGGRRFHVSLGLTLMVLVLLRLIWRATQPVPAAPSSSPGWERALARLTHYAWYVLLIALPLSGIIAVQGEGRTIVWFGLFDLPNVVPVDKGFAHDMEELHEALSTVFLVLLGVHVLAAIKHQFVDRDGLLRRMWRGRF